MTEKDRTPLQRITSVEKQQKRLDETIRTGVASRTMLETVERNLLREIAILREQIVSMGQARLDSTPVHVETVKVTQWSPPVPCVLCGKERDRKKVLTCPSCGKERMAAKTDTTKREAMRARLATCADADCGEPVTHKGNNIAYFCPKHIEQWNLWKAQN